MTPDDDTNNAPLIAGIPDPEAVNEPGVTWTAKSPRLKSGRLRKAAAAAVNRGTSKRRNNPGGNSE